MFSSTVLSRLRTGVVAVVVTTFLAGCANHGQLVAVPAPGKPEVAAKADATAQDVQAKGEASAPLFVTGDAPCVTFNALSESEIACFNKDGVFTENRKPLTPEEIEAFKEKAKGPSLGWVLVGIVALPVLLVAYVLLDNAKLTAITGVSASMNR